MAAEEAAERAKLEAELAALEKELAEEEAAEKAALEKVKAEEKAAVEAYEEPEDVKQMRKWFQDNINDLLGMVDIDENGFINT